MKTIVKSILMVDDEIPEDLDSPGSPTPYMWHYANRLLHDDRFKVEFARTVEEAKLAFQKADYNVVSIDVIMPAEEGGDLEASKNGTRTGFALLEWMIEQKKKTAVLILSLFPEEILHRDLPANLEQISAIKILEKMNTTPRSFLESLWNMSTP